MCEYKAAHRLICHAYIETVISYHINIINIYIVTKNQYIYTNAEAHLRIHIQCYGSSRIISEKDVEILYLGSYGVLARWAKKQEAPSDCLCAFKFPPSSPPNVWYCMMVAGETSDSHWPLELIISPFGSNS